MPNWLHIKWSLVGIVCCISQNMPIYFSTAFARNEIRFSTVLQTWMPWTFLNPLAYLEPNWVSNVLKMDRKRGEGRQPLLFELRGNCGCSWFIPRYQSQQTTQILNCSMRLNAGSQAIDTIDSLWAFIEFEQVCLLACFVLHPLALNNFWAFIYYKIL